VRRSSGEMLGRSTWPPSTQAGSPLVRGNSSVPANALIEPAVSGDAATLLSLVRSSHDAPPALPSRAAPLGQRQPRTRSQSAYLRQHEGGSRPSVRKSCACRQYEASARAGPPRSPEAKPIPRLDASQLDRGARSVAEAPARRSGAAPAKGWSASLAAEPTPAIVQTTSGRPAKCLIVVARLDR
jgi:hypothetical protein